MGNSREQFVLTFPYVVVITSLYQSAISRQTVKEDTVWSKGMKWSKIWLHLRIAGRIISFSI